MNSSSGQDSSRKIPGIDELAMLVENAALPSELVKILEEYLQQLRDGQAPDRQQLLSQHPHLSEQLEACLAGLDFVHQSDQNRSRQLGEFRILREIGRGGTGVVYEAEQLSLRRRVAIKTLRMAGFPSYPDAEERFQREAEIVARLHHTNIIPIFSVGRERGINYYAMQYIEGRCLATVLSAEGAAIDSARVSQWGLQAAEALAHAHQQGVIHRNVKPSSLLIDVEGRVWLTSFGIAKCNDVTVFMPGELLGTPRYMSPEQASASTCDVVDLRTDIYSLGATLYELLTNKPVFDGDSPHSVICQIMTDDPTPLRQINPTVPRDLEAIVMKCLSKDPDERYATAHELSSDLLAFLEGRRISARRASIAELATRWLRLQKRSVTLAAPMNPESRQITLGRQQLEIDTSPSSSPLSLWQQIDELYDELAELAGRQKPNSPDEALNALIRERLVRLRQLQEKDAEQMELRFRQSLSLPFGEAQRLMSEADDLLRQYAYPATGDQSADSSNHPSP